MVYAAWIWICEWLLGCCDMNGAAGEFCSCSIANELLGCMNDSLTTQSALTRKRLNREQSCGLEDVSLAAPA